MIVIYEFKKFFSEISNLFFLIALPIVMLFVLGKTTVGFIPSDALKYIHITSNNVSAEVKHTELQRVYSIMDYFGVTMLMMMSFLTCVLGANCYSEEYRLKTINRLFCSKYSRIKIFAQKSLGLIIIAAMEIVIFLLIAKGAYKINFAMHLKEEMAIIFMAFVNSVLMIFIGNILGIIFKRNTLMFIMPVFGIMMLFGGTFTGNIYLNGVSELMPIYQLQIAAFRLGTLYSYDLLKSVLYLEGIVLLCVAACAFILFYRQDEVK